MLSASPQALYRTRAFPILTHASIPLQGPKGNRGSPGEKVGVGWAMLGREWGPLVAAGSDNLCPTG